MQITRVVVAAIVFVALVPAVAHAQWSTDPLVTLSAADGPGPQVQPKLVATPGGGFYLSWFDSSTGGYDVRLQRLSAGGVEQWPHNGVLVADRSYSSTQDYGLAVDTAGNALLAFRDDRGGTDEITATVVTPVGLQPWGAAGIQVSAAAGAFVASPRIAGTTDGRVVVAWTEDADVKIVKLDAAGAIFWPTVITLTPGAGSFGVADLHASDAGSSILSFIHPTGGFGSPIELQAQKFDSATGTPSWSPAPVLVLDSAGGSLQFGNFPTFVTDGAGGAVFAWYTNSPSLQCRAQRVSSAGAELWTHNGVEVSTNASMVRVSPDVDFDPVTGETFVFWTEENALQSAWGVLGQKLDATGARQWTANGATVVPVGGIFISTIRTTAIGSGDVVVSWIEEQGTSQDVLRSSRLDGTGGPVWIPPIVDLAASSASKSRVAATRSLADFTAYAWEEGGSGAADVHVQAQTDDGALGAAIFQDGFESGDTSRWSSVSP